MPNTLEVQASFSGGEVDPELLSRRDAAFYYQSVSRARNCQVQVQGGLTHCGGTWLESPERNPLTQIDASEFVVTAPNGGTAADLVDDDLATVFKCNAATGADFVVFSIVMDATTKVEAIDLIEFFGDNESNQGLTVQVRVSAGSWNNIGIVDIKSTARTRRFALAPAKAVLIDEIRLITNSATPGQVSIGEIALWLESGTPGEVKNLNYNFSLDQQYTLVATAQNIDVFRESDGAWLAAIAVPLSDAMLSRLTFSQSLDAMTLFHEDLQTKLIERQELETEWNVRNYPYVNIPQYDFGDVAYVNGVTAEQGIDLSGFIVGDDVEISLEGRVSTSYRHAFNASDNVTLIKSALEELQNVETGVTVTHISGIDYKVEFTGGNNIDRPWGKMALFNLTRSKEAPVKHIVEGEFPGEDIMSASRGWPRCGGKRQQRQIVAGFKHLPLTIAASQTNKVFDFYDQLEIASGGLVWPLDSDNADGILAMVAIRTLIVFTENEAYFNAEDLISATSVPDFRKIDQVGLEPGVAPVPIEGGLLFLERGGFVLRQMDFSDARQSYSTGAISTLSRHLLRQPIDIARRRPIDLDRGDLIYVVNKDGSVIELTIQQAEQVAGFTLVEYKGQVKAVSCSESGVTRYSVRRTLGGVTRNWLERHDRDLWLETATKLTGVDITAAAGFDVYEGEDVRVLGDKADEQIQTVTGGTVTLASPADEVIIGFDVFPDIVDMPVIKEDEAKRELARMKRVHTLKLDLFETTSCAVQVNGGDVIDLALDDISQATYGTSIADRPFTGTVELQGFMGFSEAGTVRITQVRPGSLTVKSIKKAMVV